MWHQGIINIAQEHLATAITMQMMDRQRQAAKPRTPLGLRALVTPVKDDQHFVGARMIADLLIIDGWDVDFFWNATPDKDLAEYVQLRRVDLLAISATMPELLPNVAQTTNTIRNLDPSKPKILLGGSAITHADLESPRTRRRRHRHRRRASRSNRTPNRRSHHHQTIPRPATRRHRTKHSYRPQPPKTNPAATSRRLRPRPHIHQPRRTRKTKPNHRRNPKNRQRPKHHHHRPHQHIIPPPFASAKFFPSPSLRGN